MEEKTKKKSIYLMFVGALTLLVLVGTATFAYFQISVNGTSTNTTLNTNVESGIGVFQILGGGESLGLNLTIDNMANTDTAKHAYEATTTGGAPKAHVGTLSKTVANLGRTYTCDFDVVASASINKTIQTTDNSKFVISSASPNVTFSDDSGSTYKSTIEKPWTELSSQQTYKGKWISGLDDAETAYVDVQASIENINENQNHLAGLNGNLSFKLQNMTCTSSSNVTATRGGSPIKVTLSNVTNESTLKSNLPSTLTQVQKDNAKLVEVTVPSGSGNVEITIDVSGFAKDGETVVLYHYNGSTYDSEQTQTVTDGKVKGTFSSLSPIALVNKGLPPKYSDSTLNGADPVLGSGMIPVTIANDGKVTYADVYKGWYNYGTTNYTDTSNNNNVIPAKTWANAVMLVSSPSKPYKVGDTISEPDIANYLVWIPRYKYKLFNVGTSSTVTAQEIEISFENKNTTPSDGSTVNSWLTHPAFTSFNSNGFWVGKFELTDASNSANIQTKPNAAPAVNINVSTFFTNMKGYSTTRNSTDDSHMIKNTEWGAVAYLSYSEHGINGPIWINNTKPYTTGCSSSDEVVSQSSISATCTNPFGDVNSTYNGSTTGNISGVFDMSGGVHEYVAGYLSGYVPKSDGFASLETITGYGPKYFDAYSGSTRILGDATQETKGWNGDHTGGVYSSNPWFLRGGSASYGSSGAGQFAYAYDNGSANSAYGSRLVVTPAP